MNHFRFKQFQISDDRSAMKVGTDSVILGAWVHIENIKTAIDIGCGSGLISLMLAQRIREASISGVEIDHGSTQDAQYNFENSTWSSRLDLLQMDIRNIEYLKKYNLVITNPPFFRESLLPPEKARAGARHDFSLSLNDLLKVTSSIIDLEGVFALVYPYDREGELLEHAKLYGLYPQRILHSRNKPDAQIKRSFVEFKRIVAPEIEYESISIRKLNNVYSQEYRNLTKDFYLKF